MSEQRLHDTLSEVLNSPAAGDGAADGVARLAGARAELDRVYAAADAILDGLDPHNSMRFLEQTRQSGGQ